MPGGLVREQDLRAGRHSACSKLLVAGRLVAENLLVADLILLELVKQRRHRTQPRNSRLARAAARREQCVKIGLVEHGRFGALLQLQALGRNDVVLHAVEEHLVVKLNDIVLRLGSRINQHLHKDPVHVGEFLKAGQLAANLAGLLLVDFLVGVDQVVEEDRFQFCLRGVSLDAVGVHAADTIDRADDELVDVAAHQQVVLLTEKDLDDGPDDFAHLLVDAEVNAQLLDGLRDEKEQLGEEVVVGLHRALLFLLAAHLLFERAGPSSNLALVGENCLNSVANAGILLPREVLHNFVLQAYEVLAHASRHCAVKFNESSKCAP